MKARRASWRISITSSKRMSALAWRTKYANGLWRTLISIICGSGAFWLGALLPDGCWSRRSTMLQWEFSLLLCSKTLVTENFNSSDDVSEIRQSWLKTWPIKFVRLRLTEKFKIDFIQNTKNCLDIFCMDLHALEKSSLIRSFGSTIHHIKIQLMHSISYYSRKFAPASILCHSRDAGCSSAVPSTGLIMPRWKRA